MKRVMYIEYKGQGLVGPARIGWVKVSDKGKRLDYGNQAFRTMRGTGFKSNYRDTDTHEEYWISGCRKDGRDALYNTEVEIDEDALDEYWLNIRKQPENKSVRLMSAMGKCK
ncbi:MAG: 1-deoxy-D-xylulose-5-phosphate synthase [Acidobacteriota bacterium]